MSNILTAIISADGKQFTKTLVDLTAQLKRFEEGLKTTKGVESIARLNRAIEITKARMEAIKGFSNLRVDQLGRLTSATNSANNTLLNTGRILQDLPFGFIGVANNVNPLLESFQRLVKETGSVGAALKVMASSLGGGGGLGLAFSAITSAMSFATLGFSAFSRGVGGAKKEVTDAAIEFEKFKQSIEAIGNSFQIFSDNIDFETKLASISLQIQGFQGGALALRDANLQIDQNNKKLTELDTKLFIARVRFNDLKRPIDGLAEGSSKLRELISQFGNSIPESLISDLGDVDKDLAKRLAIANDEVKKLQKERSDILNSNKLLNQQASLAFFQQIKEQDDKILQQMKEFIAKAKEIQSRFPELVPDKIDELYDSFRVAFEKAGVIVDDFIKGFPRRIGKLTQIKFEDIEFELVSPKINILSPDFKTDTASIERLHNALFPQKSKYQEALDFIAQYKANLQNLGNIVQSTLTPAFEGFFNQLLQGTATIKSFIEGLGNAIKQLIAKLAAAAVLAGIISLLTGGKNAVGGLSFLGAFKQILGFRAQGGPVRGGGSYIVGENGPEVFTPNTSGMIIPNGSYGRVSSSGMTLNISGEFITRGNDLVLVYNKAVKAQTTA